MAKVQESQPGSKKPRKSSPKKSASTSPLPAPAKWYLLVHEDGDVAAQLETFDEEQALQQRVLTLIGKPAWVHIFYGWCGGITAPPFRYLMLPGKEPFPLFSPPQVPQIQEELFEGTYLGPCEDWEDPELTALTDVAEVDVEGDADEDVPLDEVLEPEDEFYFDDEDGGVEQE